MYLLNGKFKRGKVFFTSDTHFGSTRTLNFSKRPFKNIRDMDRILIENWNSIITDEDTVFHLGDFGNFNQTFYLNGRKILIKGNYEKDNSNDELLSYFHEVYEGNHIIRINNHLFNLTHEPINCNKKVFNLFGHIHKLQMVKSFGLNVGSDCHNFKPISLEDVLFYKKAINEHYDDNVFMV